MPITMNDSGALRALEAGIAATSNLTPAMEEIAGELLAISDAAFSLLADPNTGQAWPPLTLGTIAERKKLGYSPGEVLQREGTLRGEVGTEVGPNFVDVGSPVEYALVHQLGGTPPQNIPPRPYVGASPEDLLEFEDILSDFILSRVN